MGVILNDESAGIEVGIVTEKYFLEFAINLADKIMYETEKYYHDKLITGLVGIRYVDNCDDTKSEHKIDKHIKTVINKFIADEYPELRESAIILMEDTDRKNDLSGKTLLFIDPVDGSRCADQNIGDPCFMIAYGHPQTESSIRFGDLVGCYVRGLKSGDAYFTYQGRAYYIPEGHTFEIGPNGSILLDSHATLKPLNINSDVEEVANSSIVIRDGYGMRQVVTSKINHDILNEARHCFSHDISGAELCYLAAGRGIVHIVVEARKHVNKAGNISGSDGFNLIPYPLIKAAGGMVYTLEGETYEGVVYDPAAIYDFVACTNKKLLKEFIEKGTKKKQ